METRLLQGHCRRPSPFLIAAFPRAQPATWRWWCKFAAAAALQLQQKQCRQPKEQVAATAQSAHALRLVFQAQQ